MLSRIPAVKWAFNRLRPLPHGGSLDVAPIAADEEPALIAEAAPALDSAAEPVVAESLSAAPADISVSDDSSVETLAEVEPVIEEEFSASSVDVASETVDAPELINSYPPAELLTDVEPDDVEAATVSAVEVEAVGAPEPLIISDASQELPADIEPVVEELVCIAPVETETVSVEPSELITEDEPASVASVELEPVAIDETPIIVVDAEVPTPVVAAASIDSEPAPSVTAAIEPVVANDLPPVAAILAEETIADAPAAATDIAPAPVSPAAKGPGAPKARAKIVEPADRAALIRQRWTETGIRMWNPRLHGTGDATLNIQGRIGLLPPEPGETMPRYDKLEFKMLGGQIVCEGVIVEAPLHAGQRSFTRLAEPRGADRSTSEPMRERQAALA
ncbi:hypothetical protein FXB40_05170 [Bradyrhizobium rifense]|uniref:Uncharacterized protein n=1 Tax=Bradyrhizobium rifense TaxID=515499 RepID=A0A5D3KZ86_9BRAD|nr:hypothetical protein FXB40_05170 [Bradyrhizobium rifense]